MSKKVNGEVVNLEQVQVHNLPELQGWKEKLEKIVADNPFVEITDHKTYTEAKKRRTALRSGRTEVENQDKLIASKLSEMRKKAKGVAFDELIPIVKPKEEKQQEEVKRYEAERQAEKEKKEREEQERLDLIKADIQGFYDGWNEDINNLQFDEIKDFKERCAGAIAHQNEKDFDIYQSLHMQNVESLKDKLKERIEWLNEKEEARVEAEKLRKEREAFEKEQEEKEIRNKKREAEAKERREAEEEKIRQERAEMEAEKEKMAQERFNTRMEKLKALGYEVSPLGQIINDEYTIVTDRFEDDIYNCTPVAFQGILDEAESRLAEEKAAWEKWEKEKAEEAERQAKIKKEQAAAEKKRLKALQPDKVKLHAWIDSLVFTETIGKLKSEEATGLEESIRKEFKEFIEGAKQEIEALK